MSNTFVHNSNGDGKRSSRVALSEVGSEGTGDTMGPRTPAEELVAAVLCSFLGVERLGIHESFFDLGGNSLLGQQIVLQLRSVFRIELPVLSLFEMPTVAALVSAMAHMWGGREIVEEIAWTFTEVQRLSDFETRKALEELSMKSVASK